MPAVRLNKVLRELNISIDRAVDFLDSKGYQIEKRPTSKISQEIYELLCSEFQSDADKKVASKEIAEAQIKEKEELRLEKEKELEESNKKKKEQEVITAASKVTKFKKLGKIDLDPKPKADKPIQEEKPKPKEKAELKEESKQQDEKQEVKTDSNENVVDNYKKLTGLKSTGETIDLSKFKEDSSPKKKEEKTTSKKRRKRIITNPKAGDQNKKFKASGRVKSKSKSKKGVKEEPNEEEVQKQIKETLEKLQGKSAKGKAAKYRREKREQHRQKSEEELAVLEEESKVIKVTEFVTASEIATMMNVPSTDIISACMTLGIMVTMNQRLDAETLSIVAEEFGYKVEFVTAEIEEESKEVVDDPKDLKPRAPIVTVMGHVDHGKTSLLDYIRKENVIAGESGGITQHIGAYSVELNEAQKITFLDTPGHEAFTAMRARGAQLTDLAIIVVAADDDIMPQTKEAISHAQAASVPIVFAINKIDKPDANPDKIKESLSNMNLLVEDWGGKIQSHDISAKTGDGVNELLEKVILEAEFLELKANPDRYASGTVVEAFLDKGRGYVSTILVQTGTLKIGDFVLAGKNTGKVKAMFDERGNDLQTASPSTPVSILGLDGAAQAGDNFSVYNDEREAKQIATKRNQLQREQSVRTQRHITLDEIGRRIALGEFKELNIILKGDVDGSVEALTDSFQQLSTEEIQVNIIHKGVGAITESDVLLASASDALVIGFNVRPMGNARQVAEKEEIDIRIYSIIYDAINELKDAMEGMLSPDIKEEVTGLCEVRDIFKISKLGTIAGCMVTKGSILRNSEVRLIREGVVIFSGSLSSLKRFKDDVKEVKKGYDCGLQINDFKDIKVGDEIEGFINVEVKKKL
ncbi:MAG TPA: translation initiation factor IF-2 [Flavobacteriaceae bacterium]|nr:translation initiation factor IF-2 [Flavobacteriaceae bacterium]